MAGKPSKKQRKVVKKPKAKAPVQPVAAQPIQSETIPDVRRLSRQAIGTLWRHKKLFAGIIVIYGLLNLIFVTGFGAGIDVAGVRNQFSSRVIGGLAAYTQLISGSGSTSDQAASVYQSVFFMVASLALIWALRQVYAGNTVRIRDAYYKGMYPLVPAVLVLLWVAVQMIPLIIGVNAYSFVVANGIAATAIEVILWGLLALALALVSLYFLAVSLFGFYVSTLPDMTPVKALRLAKQLVKGRRWTVLRKVLFLPLMLVLITAVILLPVIFIVPALAQVLLLLLGPALLAVGHSYLYSLYRGLMHD